MIETVPSLYMHHYTLTQRAWLQLQNLSAILWIFTPLHIPLVPASMGKEYRACIHTNKPWGTPTTHSVMLLNYLFANEKCFEELNYFL